MNKDKKVICLKSKRIESNKSVDEIEMKLGFDKTEPIMLTESDAQDRLNKGEDFGNWYKEELKNFYKTHEATVEVKEEKYIKEIINSINSKTAKLDNDKNRFALELLKKARRK